MILVGKLVAQRVGDDLLQDRVADPCGRKVRHNVPSDENVRLANWAQSVFTSGLRSEIVLFATKSYTNPMSGSACWTDGQSTGSDVTLPMVTLLMMRVSESALACWEPGRCKVWHLRTL